MGAEGPDGQINPHWADVTGRLGDKRIEDTTERGFVMTQPGVGVGVSRLERDKSRNCRALLNPEDKQAAKAQ